MKTNSTRPLESRMAAYWLLGFWSCKRKQTRSLRFSIDPDPTLKTCTSVYLQASEELEDRQSLAVMAASGQDEVTGPDGETFIEKYTRGVSAVETILTLDRLRQSVAVKELITARSKHLLPMGGQTASAASAASNSPFMRKTVSVPNISHVSDGRVFRHFFGP